MVSSKPLPPTRTEAEEVVYLTRELARAELKIRALEERLRLELMRKYGPKSEQLNDAQLLLLDLEPGVSNQEVEAEAEREPLPPPAPETTKKRKSGNIRDGRNCPRVCRAWSVSFPAHPNSAFAKPAAKKRW
jgi:hypothetical protein